MEIIAALRHRECQRPRNEMIAGAASNRAAALIRAVAAAAGDQPAPVNDRANDPDVLNVAADSNASASPVLMLRSRFIRPHRFSAPVMSENTLH
jgi:hypothetical protein